MFRQSLKMKIKIQSRLNALPGVSRKREDPGRTSYTLRRDMHYAKHALRRDMAPACPEHGINMSAITPDPSPSPLLWEGA
jgi:hypothetical protein